MRKWLFGAALAAVTATAALGGASIAIGGGPGDPSVLAGSYAFRLTGETPTGPGTFAPVAMVGRLTFDREGAALGERLLTAGGNPTPQPATMTCTAGIGATGTGVLTCDVTEAPSPVPTQRETYRFEAADHNSTLELLFVTSIPLVPGAPTISGTAISGTATQ